MANMLVAIIQLLATLLSTIIFVNALLSFVLPPWHTVRRVLGDLSEPIIAPFRRILPPTGMIDFSPMVAIIAIQLLAALLKGAVIAAFGY